MLPSSDSWAANVESELCEHTRISAHAALGPTPLMDRPWTNKLDVSIVCSRFHHRTSTIAQGTVRPERVESQGDAMVYVVKQYL